MWLIITYLLNGMIGALVNILISSKNIYEIREYEKLRTLILGLIAGYVYYHLHFEYNLPNSFMTIVFGYFSNDVFEKLFNRLRSRIENI